MDSHESIPSAGGDAGLEIPEFTFRPNVWTEAFLSGLRTIPILDKRVAEIGVGSGVVGIDLLNRGVGQYVGMDIDPRVLPVAQRNIAARAPRFAHKATLLQSDLLKSLPEDHSFDIICGCLPQVARPPTVELGSGDSYARYFDPDQYTSSLNVYGLGLNEGALTQAKTRLKSDGGIILVLSGRAGQTILRRFFQEQGYQPRIVFEGIVAQLRETTLTTLVEAEELGYEFFFYEDIACYSRITTKEAEKRRLNGQDSYHKIYVIEGKL